MGRLKFIPATIAVLALFYASAASAFADDHRNQSHPSQSRGNTQNRPNNNQSRPNHNQDRPNYNQNRPNYNQNRPSYNQNRPSYNPPRSKNQTVPRPPASTPEQGHHSGQWLRRYKDVPLEQQEKALSNDPQFRSLPQDRQQRFR